ncbi:MAG: hypothetical protein K2O84_07940 [Oscillospiraceae bacterium]|nr:hypothetical protein [Oscillospiraceae bacterium]
MHPVQTSVSGNAGSATKLATSRTIHTNLASTTEASFNGTANVTPGVTGILPISNGGTGGGTASEAREQLGALSSKNPTYTGGIAGQSCSTGSGSGTGSVSIGYACSAVNYSAAIGVRSRANAERQIAIGHDNRESTDTNDILIVGKGSVNNRSNCFRATATGVFATGAYNSTGADYAELFEWLDGNRGGQDRVGRFVTLDGAKIRLAGPEDDYILGIVSGNPSVVGDVHDDQWQGMYLCDIFGRPIWEDMDIPEELDPDGGIILPARTERRQKLNPAYDRTQTYLPRSQRPEWAAVGLLGKLVALDDGSCQVNGWCTVGVDGQAAASQKRTRFRVMSRLDESHVQVLIL